jgi:hypothetical protein
MQRLAFAALVLAACGTTDDERPQNLDYVTEAILAPSCGGSTCHSEFAQTKGYVFDNIAGARRSFQNDPQLIGFDESDPERIPGLVLNLTLEQPKAPRMPYSYPLPDVDVALIKRWLQFGAPGVCTGATACLGAFVLPCQDVKTHKNPDVVEKAAYDLTKIPTARNCAVENKTCVDGDCQ